MLNLVADQNKEVVDSTQYTLRPQHCKCNFALARSSAHTSWLGLSNKPGS